MDMFRPLIGFVVGLVVMAGVYAAGLLDGVPHWSRNFTHWSHGSNDADPDHAHYKISTVFQPSGGDEDEGGNCAPRFEFHNHTSRNVAFSADGDDDTDDGGGSGYGGPYNQGHVSTTPDQANAGPPSNGTSRKNGSRDDDQQGYDSQGDGGQSYDDAQGYGSGRDYDAGSQYGPYDDEYPGPSGGGCSAGVVQVYLDRNK